jgi:heme-degrading monooxygenase HmoA
MILEIVTTHVQEGKEAEFEAAFKQASQLLAQAMGYIGHELRRSLETKGRYVNMVRWESVDDHMIGFRGSDAYQEFRALITPYFAAPSQMEHYEVVYQNP